MLQRFRSGTGLYRFCMASKVKISTPQQTRHESMDPEKCFEEDTYRNYVIQSYNTVGILAKVMRIFNTNNIDVSYIDNTLYNVEKDGTHRVDFNVSATPIDHEKLHIAGFELAKLNSKLIPGPVFEVDWYPRNEEELNLIGKVLLNVKDTEGGDSQQFMDPQYRKRRNEIASIGKTHRIGDPIPIIKYNKEEDQVWVYCYEKLRKLHKQCMSRRFQKQMERLERHFDFHKRIPQLRDLEGYLEAETGFRIRPTHGILSQREFLNAFAHRVFCCTQYIRHPSNPEYTPEPDVIHQIIGHVPMFADKQVADLSHQIGLLSLGATDKQIAQLGTMYWYTLQFGACKEANEIKAYGAGIASSFGELEHFMSGKPKFEPFDPIRNANDSYPIQTVQPLYKYTDSFEEALKQVRNYGKTISKKASMYYDFRDRKVITNRQVRGIYRGEAGPLF